MTKAIVLGGSRGIGKAISDSLKSINLDVIATSKNDLDTSNLDSVSEFVEKYKETDILVLNTGGPDPKEFFSITEKDWNHYHNQLFLGFCLLLQKLKINDNGYIFVISSNVIKEPTSKLIISGAYRSSYSSVFKITDRTKELIDDVENFAKTLPMKRLGKPQEIGDFVKSIVENNIKYLSGVVINFDGANSNFVY